MNEVDTAFAIYVRRRVGRRQFGTQYTGHIIAQLAGHVTDNSAGSIQLKAVLQSINKTNDFNSLGHRRETNPDLSACGMEGPMLVDREQHLCTSRHGVHALLSPI